MKLFKNYALKDWMGSAERYEIPLKMGKYQPGAARERDALIRAGKSGPA
jgi:phage gp29-like protein